jgi:phage terminase large subunit-like protein
MMRNHDAEQYAEDVRSGKVVACHWVQQAVERYYNDLDNAVEKGWVFSRAKAERAISFVEKLRHTKGRWAGTYLVLEPWQKFILWVLEGFLMADTGLRRFTEAYIEVPRKNAKSTLAAAISLLHGYADKELGAEVYYAATTRDQARICFEMAKKMVQMSDLKTLSVVTRDAFSYNALGTTHKPLSSEAGNLDGLSPSCTIIDEYHAHKTDEVVDVMATGQGARSQALMFIITTAGLSTSVPCYKYRKTMTEVLDGIVEADRTLAIIYTLDDPEEAYDPKMWIKANPNLGVSLGEDWLAEQVAKMRREPNKIAGIMTKCFNIWMDAPTVWIPDRLWSEIESVVPQSNLDGCQCIAALDLASVNDYCSLCLMFNEAGRYQYLWRFYIPEDKYQDRYNLQRENANIEAWVRNGYVTITPGNATDYDYILADISQLAEQYQITTLAYDPWNAAAIVPKLVERGVNLQPFTQTIGNYAMPTREFERIVTLGIVDHYDNPVARWMLSNVVIREDVNGNRRPDKGKSSEKIDGIVAAIMALGQHLSDKGERESVYENYRLIGAEDDEPTNNNNDYDDGDYYDYDDY